MPQAFKGSLGAHAAASAMARGCRIAHPEAKVVELPMADGGDDTLDVLVGNTGGQLFEATVLGPLGNEVQALWGVLGDGQTAIVEMARASGLRLLDNQSLDPGRATTFGTGQLVLAALNAGYRDILVGVGGSATVDGGAGALRALGIRFLDQNHVPLPEGGLALQGVSSIDASGLDPRFSESRVRVLCDVAIPVSGPGGAREFMAQKGCDGPTITLLCAGLDQYCHAVLAETGVALHDMPLAGPAGGLAGGLHAFLGAELLHGASVILASLAIEDLFDAADLVIVGEGRFDTGSLLGKGLVVVAQAARDAHVPVLAICGQVAPDLPGLEDLGIAGATAIADAVSSPAEAMLRAAELLEGTTKRAVSDLFARPTSGATEL